MTTYQIAVRKASRFRLLRDMRHAARLVEGVYVSSDRALDKHTAWARGFVMGALTETPSLTVRACLFTAFGG